MKNLLGIFLLFAVTYVNCSKLNYDQNFANYEIVPDIVDHAPPRLIKVEYKKSHKEANLGNVIEPKDVKDVPTLTFEADPKSFYTLIMTDPDAPSHKNPVMKEWNHWLVVNIPGSDVSKGETITEYVGSAPPKDTGLHRYALLVFKQPKKLTFDEPHKDRTDGNRGKFNTKKFVEKYGLGDPVAGNYFEARYDDSVPETHKQFKN